MSPYSITREDAAKDANCLRDALSVLREVGGGINEDATIRLTALADSIQEQARTVVEPSEWDSLVIAGTNDYPDRVRWQRDADGFWQAEVQGVTSRWGRLQDPEVLRIGVGEATDPILTRLANAPRLEAARIEGFAEGVEQTKSAMVTLLLKKRSEAALHLHRVAYDKAIAIVEALS